MSVPVWGLVAFLVFDALVVLVIVWAVLASGPDEAAEDEAPAAAPAQEQQVAAAPPDEAAPSDGLPDVAAAAPEPVRPLALPGARLTVSVRAAANDAPLPQATVTAGPRPPGPEGDLVGSPGPDGTWQLTLPPGCASVVISAEAPGFRSQQRELAVAGRTRLETTLRLVEGDGYLLRVVTPLGDPVPGAWVEAWLDAPPRPTLSLPDGGGEAEWIAWRPAARRVVGSYSDQDGLVLLPALPDEGLLDLVLQGSAEDLAATPLRVPLPWPGNELPDLVMRPLAPLRVRAVGSDGRPLLNVEVTVDERPGRPVARTRPGPALTTDLAGELLLRRHAGRVHLSANHQHGMVLTAAWSGAEPLPWIEQELASDGPLAVRRTERWVTVGAGLGELTLQLDTLPEVSGYVLDEATGRPLADVQVTAHDPQASDRRPLAEGRSEVSGRFRLKLPPDWQLRFVRLEARSPDHGPVWTEALASRHPGAAAVTLALEALPLERQLSLHGLRGGWWTPKEAVVLAGPPGSFAPGAAQDAWWLVGWTNRYRSLRLPWSVDEDDLMVVALYNVEGQAVPVTCGPLRGDEVLISDLSRALTWPARHPVRVTGLEQDRAGLVVAATGRERLLGEVVRRGQALEGQAGPHDELLMGRVPVDDQCVELLQPRWPVDALLARWDRAVDPLTPEGRVSLAVPSRHLVKGRVELRESSDLEHVGVALLGPGTEAWRPEVRGQGDWWTRPDGLGLYRFEAVPRGEYTCVLFRAEPGLPVEVLSRRRLMVDATLFQVDVSEAPRLSGDERISLPLDGFDGAQAGGR